jgi:predicted amidohydrolase YtcJ
VTEELVDQTQSIDIKEAIRLFTYNGAYASNEETQKGSIEVGKLADLVVLSEDIHKCPKDKIRDLVVDFTVIDGFIEYERNLNVES